VFEGELCGEYCLLRLIIEDSIFLVLLSYCVLS
jgi:hypothetical protein